MPTFKACFVSPVDPLFIREFEYGTQFQAEETVAHYDFGYGVIKKISVNENPDDDVLLDILVDWISEPSPEHEKFADWVFRRP